MKKNKKPNPNVVERRLTGEKGLSADLYNYMLTLYKNTMDFVLKYPSSMFLQYLILSAFKFPSFKNKKIRNYLSY